MESHMQMLRDLTMDTMGNSLLSDDVTLESLASMTENLGTLELEQLVKIANHSALYRLWMQAPHLEALGEVVVLVTMDDFVLALKDVNAAINT
jgi:SpoVK/Ycf46/Vps4 family AAA+-type ATPase